MYLARSTRQITLKLSTDAILPERCLELVGDKKGCIHPAEYMYQSSRPGNAVEFLQRLTIYVVAGGLFIYSSTY